MSGCRLICEVRGNGPGNPADCLDSVLEFLFSTKCFGTGLGSPTVQRIVEEHGGGMEIQSDCGWVTLVGIWVPFDQLAEEDGRNDRAEHTDRR